MPGNFKGGELWRIQPAANSMPRLGARNYLVLNAALRMQAPDETRLKTKTSQEI